jgi:ornithine carbamoyltransferase
MPPKHFLTLRDWTKNDISSVIKRSLEIKAMSKSLKLPYSPTPLKRFEGKTMSMIFNKRSTRTRVSAESGFVEFGGHPLFLSNQDIQLGYK